MDQVMVVGAGPVGLWVAAELARGGVPVTVLEKDLERSPHSKALGLHARTLEILASRGLVERFLAEGRPVPSWHFGMLETRVDLSPLETQYPYMLALPQRRTEELIEEYATDLGVKIVRGHTVTGLRQDDGQVTLTLNGTQELTARYVVGADGSRSAVRELAGVDFPGTEPTAYGFIGEVVLDAPPPGGMLNAHGPDGALIVLPLGDGRFRVTGVDVRRQAPGDKLTLETLRDFALQMAGSDFGMHDPSWLTRFSNRTRVAATYQLNRVLLAGDAAHITWPAGGVGLNVGLQDATNLGWKLAAEINGTAPGALTTYHDERHPIGAELAQYTLAQGALINGTDPSGQALRAFLSDQLATNTELNLHLARKLSGLAVSYGPAVGLRALDLIPVAEHDKLAAALTTSQFVEVHLTGTTEGGPGIALPAGNRAEELRIASFVVRPDGHVESTTPIP